MPSKNPVGVVSGIQLVEYGTGRIGDFVRLACDVLVGIPSIVIGLFIYAVLVTVIAVLTVISLGRLAARIGGNPIEFKYPSQPQKKGGSGG